MTPTQGEALQLLKSKGLRVTASRVAVLKVILNAPGPLSHSDVLIALNHETWDPTTVYRNLIKLRDTGLIVVINRANGLDRYVINYERDEHELHPHFFCNDCGQVSCLPASLSSVSSADERWRTSIQRASIQLRGECPDCIDKPDSSS